MVAGGCKMRSKNREHFPCHESGQDILKNASLFFHSLFLHQNDFGPGGLLLAGLMLWRVVLRGLRGAPGLPGEMSAPERTAAKIGHFVLYALLIAIPVLGILLTWFRGDALTFFGLVTVPAPFAPDRTTARTIRELHSLCANGILIAAGLHAAAALYHHFIRRDAILTRMLPKG